MTRPWRHWASRPCRNRAKPPLRSLHNPKDGALLDEALVVRLQAHSFTGEAMAELHVHGGLAVIESVLEALSALPGLRAAEAGEFTRRAVLNGKMDLTAAEAIADLIDAEGGAQQKQALAQLRGGLRRRAEGWREGLKTLLAHLEADLEFADEDLPGGIGQKALDGLPALQAELSGALSDDTGLRLRDGLRVALVGPPNAGKSSILNMLAGRAAAIVSARAGTTRDIIEVAMLLAGVPVTLIDTAGLRAAGDDIEREGVRRAIASAEEADIVVWVGAPDVPQPTALQDDVLAAHEARPICALPIKATSPQWRMMGRCACPPKPVPVRRPCWMRCKSWFCKRPAAAKARGDTGAACCHFA